jgi:hypothetical protein
MSCTIDTAITLVLPAPPRVRQATPGPILALLVLWEVFQETREMRNAAPKACLFDGE